LQLGLVDVFGQYRVKLIDFWVAAGLGRRIWAISVKLVDFWVAAGLGRRIWAISG
jgi:type IV secretory pathway TrbD component